MTNRLVVLALASMLCACGDQGGQTTAPPSTGGEAAAPAAAPPTAAPAAETPAAAPPAPAAAAPAGGDEEVKYDPIDVSKLDNSWYRQFGGGK